ncbi:helix-turn-helix domain-containing protein [Streptomyces chartreusis]|uniref:helix-turn-helix domain-containing protein n=1 Tax=Streptomyces chartreusis TaxID=1969 RepID=UPI003D941EBB
MTRATRQIVVAHLAERGMDPATIASELGVSCETVCRDLTNPPSPLPAAESTEVAPVVADAEVLVLRLDEALRASLALLRGVCNGPDNEVQNVAAARAAIHATADHFRERTPTRT